MSESRYPALTAILEKRISQGVYRDKIPTVRQLVEEFGVAKQTVTRALKPLIDRGVIVTDGRRGMRVLSVVPEGGVIGIIAYGDMRILEKEQGLKELQEQIHSDGFEPVLIAISNKITPRNVCKLLTSSFAGFIFTNSTLSFEAAEHLDKHGIPFVSCNRLPVYSRPINYVETNWRHAIKRLAIYLKSNDHQEVGLFFHGRLEGYNRVIVKEWQKIKKELELPIREYDSIRLNYRTSAYENLCLYLKQLSRLKEQPKVIVSWHTLNDDFLRELTAGPYSVPPQTRIFGFAAPGITYSPNITIIENVDAYRHVLTAAYAALREIVLAPTAKKIHRFVDCEIRIIPQML